MTACACGTPEKRSDRANKDEIQQLRCLDRRIQNLIHQAIEARLYSYSPFSNFKVGAAVLCEDGSVYSGCNIENRAFPVGICAEVCAFSKAISDGKMKFRAAAVVAQQDTSFTTPCGACRQFMSEYGSFDVYITKPNCNEVLVLTLAQLLPYQFESKDNAFT